jgi:hypothetical protein
MKNNQYGFVQTADIPPPNGLRGIFARSAISPSGNVCIVPTRLFRQILLKLARNVTPK